MKWTLIFLCGLMLAFPQVSSSSSDPRYDHSPWVRVWENRNQSISKSLRAASSIFDVSYSWLKACNNSEAGNNMHYNYEGSGAFGPMQFMHGTFYSHVRNAFKRAKVNRRPVPYRFARWDSRVGQAITAAYMFSVGKSYHWTGRGC